MKSRLLAVLLTLLLVLHVPMAAGGHHRDDCDCDSDKLDFHYMSENCPPSWVESLSFNNGRGPSVSQIGIGGSTTATTNYNATGGLVGVYSPLQQINGLSGTYTAMPDGNIQYTLSANNQPLAGQLGGKVSFNFTVSVNGTIAGQLTAQAKYDLDNGQAQSVWDVTGNVTGSDSTCNHGKFAGDPVGMSTGEYVSNPTADLFLGGPLPLQFRRHYGSLIRANGITGRLGVNWTHNFETKLAILGSDATVNTFDGVEIEFTQSGGKWVAEQKQPRAYQLAQAGTNYHFLDAATNLIYTFSSSGALMRIEDRNGNALTITQPNQVSDGLGRTLTMTYGSDGNLASVKDQTGRTVSFTYSGSNLATVTDANGKVTTYNYTSAFGKTGLIASVKRPAGNTTVAQAWDQQGRVARQIDGLNNATAFAYDNPAGTGVRTDPLGYKTVYSHADLKNNNAITDANGKVTTVAYDAANRPTLITDRLGNRTTIAYDPTSGREASRTDASGAVTASSYTAQIQGPFTFYVPSKRTFADGSSSSYQYDANGNLLSVTDQVGKVTQFTYNKRGQRLTVQNAAGGVTTYTYNDDGTLASMKAPSGDLTQYSYDAQKRVAKVIQPDGATESFDYDARDRVTQHTFGAGAPQMFSYDDNGNLHSRTDTRGSVTFSYDANDRRVSSMTASGNRSVTYDEVGRPKAVTIETGERVSTTYDAVGRPMARMDASGNGSHFARNAQGFLQSITDANSQTTLVTTDPLGRILSLTTPLSEKYSYTYDKAGRRVSETTPLAHMRKSSYDARGALARVDLPMNISASYTRDDLGWISRITDPNGGAWTRTHDNMGRLTAISDPLSRTTTVQYGARNRISGASSAAGTVSLSYDAIGNLTRAQFGDGTDLNYQYAGRRLASADSLSLTYGAYGRVATSNGIANTFDAVGRLTSVTYGPGLTVTYKYNNVGLLTEVDDWVGGATLLKYDGARRLISVQRPDGSITTYVRDSNGRVKSKNESTASGTYSLAASRDAEGKIVSEDRNLPQAPQPVSGFNGHSYDAAHQVVGATDDAAGRLTSDGLRSYTWDQASRLISYSGVDGAAQFTYDGLGLRVSRTTADGVQNYVWNYGHALPALAIVRSGGDDLRYYVYLPGGSLLHSIEAAGNLRRFYHYDFAGSTTFLTDDSGAVSVAYGIAPFGESVTQAGETDNPFTFHGEFGVMQEGATSLYYMRARYYDSASGRFLSRDPVASLDPLQINPYQFAMNDPIRFRDPRGTSAEPQIRRYGISLGSLGSRLSVPREIGYAAANQPEEPGFRSIETLAALGLLAEPYYYYGYYFDPCGDPHYWDPPTPTLNRPLDEFIETPPRVEDSATVDQVM